MHFGELPVLDRCAFFAVADLGADARLASLKAAKGSIASSASMVHAKALVAGSNTAPVSMEGVSVAISNGYPTAVKAFANDAAGLSDADYTITATGKVLTVQVKGAATAANCQFTYTEADTGKAPTYADPTTLDCK